MSNAVVGTYRGPFVLHSKGMGGFEGNKRSHGLSGHRRKQPYWIRLSAYLDILACPAYLTPTR